MPFFTRRKPGGMTLPWPQKRAKRARVFSQELEQRPLICCDFLVLNTTRSSCVGPAFAQGLVEAVCVRLPRQLGDLSITEFDNQPYSINSSGCVHGKEAVPHFSSDLGEQLHGGIGIDVLPLLPTVILSARMSDRGRFPQLKPASTRS